MMRIFPLLLPRVRTLLAHGKEDGRSSPLVHGWLSCDHVLGWRCSGRTQRKARPDATISFSVICVSLLQILQASDLDIAMWILSWHSRLCAGPSTVEARSCVTVVRLVQLRRTACLLASRCSYRASIPCCIHDSPPFCDNVRIYLGIR